MTYTLKILQIHVMIYQFNKVQSIVSKRIFQKYKEIQISHKYIFFLNESSIIQIQNDNHYFFSAQFTIYYKNLLAY